LLLGLQLLDLLAERVPLVAEVGDLLLPSRH
jgi:hypothetical protein